MTTVWSLASDGGEWAVGKDSRQVYHGTYELRHQSANPQGHRHPDRRGWIQMGPNPRAEVRQK
jgi:hypothetical protein